MAKYINSIVPDAALAKIATGTTITVCSDQPTNRTEAVTTYKLADATLTPGDGNGSFTIAAGSGTARKVTIAQQADIPVDATDDATHVAICDGTNLLLVTTCTLQPVTSGNTVTIPAFSHEIGAVS